MTDRQIQEKRTYRMESVADTGRIASKILQDYPSYRIYLLKGDLGAGKTTLVQAFCRVLHTVEQAKSPTFSIINEYQSPSGSVYHFDFYRLEAEEEAFTLGLEEYWDSGSYCFVEWPEKVSSWLPRNALLLNISLLSGEERNIHLTPFPVTP